VDAVDRLVGFPPDSLVLVGRGVADDAFVPGEAAVVRVAVGRREVGELVGLVGEAFARLVGVGRVAGFAEQFARGLEFLSDHSRHYAELR
jgi:sugar (pentulose or hexulose) kinase